MVYTYDVYWELTDISWASRWDAYLRMPGGRVHWFSILNSLMVVVVMSSIVAMIMLRTIRRDLARYEGILGDAGRYFRPAMIHEVCIESDWAHRPALRTMTAGHAYAVWEEATVRHPYSDNFA